MTAPHPSRRKAATIFILVTAVLDIMAMGLVIPVLPSLIEEFTGSNAGAGWINGVFVALWAGMQFLASPVIGSLSDRFGRRPLMLPAPLLAAGGSLILAAGADSPARPTPSSARNRMPGLVTRVVRDTVMAQVEIQAGPFRVVSLMSREAADELGLEVGVRAVATVKATQVSVDVP